MVKAAPFQFTLEEETKPFPVTESEIATEPAVAELGETEVRLGAGLLIVKVAALLVPPPGVGVNTVTEAVPAKARLAAATFAVS